tara:strand:- start:689 stop:790 length:102 start_codon:yes stop_codon:yes gene_type:complete
MPSLKNRRALASILQAFHPMKGFFVIFTKILAR